MAGTHPLQGNPNAPELKKEAGKYVKKLREEVGLTQQELARAVGMDYYTTISQIERGVTRVPPDKVRAFAEAFKVKRSVFALRLTSYYDPHLWLELNELD